MLCVIISCSTGRERSISVWCVVECVVGCCLPPCPQSSKSHREGKGHWTGAMHLAHIWLLCGAVTVSCIPHRTLSLCHNNPPKEIHTLASLSHINLCIQSIYGFYILHSKKRIYKYMISWMKSLDQIWFYTGWLIKIKVMILNTCSIIHYIGCNEMKVMLKTSLFYDD